MPAHNSALRDAVVVLWVRWLRRRPDGTEAALRDAVVVLWLRRRPDGTEATPPAAPGKQRGRHRVVTAPVRDTSRCWGMP
ncbi:hypothetical protein ACFVTM_10385 [Arthrobacter sp. NPDC058130]|uniref:hypothetical protein n=1 Tax=Arthrobacter sp. NPDC058130 TaxID=3346353 RepID=UPI0036F055D1